MLPKILLLEDDHIQRDMIRDVLQKELRAEVICKNSESEFRRDLEQIAAHPPQAAILDCMVRWANPSREMPVRPPEVPNDPQNAGLRCGDLLRKDPRTSRVKIILYSVFSKADFDRSLLTGEEVCLVKEPDYRQLVEAVKALVESPEPVA
jgi:CheY-like chemotaxis protein